MNEALLMNDLKRGERLDRQRDRLAEGHRSAQDPVGQRLAGKQFHGDEERVLLFADFENLTDVRMVDRRRSARFIEQAPPCLAIARCGDDLQCDVTIQAHVAGAIDLAHTSGAEE